jgi:hypothetical protein
MTEDADLVSSCHHHIYQLRAVIHGISPLIWRRLLLAAQTTIAELHAIVQTVFGWDGEALHRFDVHGTEYGMYAVGGPWFRDDARTVRLADLGLRPREWCSYEYNFHAGWHVDLRVEQIRAAELGKQYPRCTGGRRAGPPEDWGGPWEFVQRTPAWRIRRRSSLHWCCTRERGHPGQHLAGTGEVIAAVHPPLSPGCPSGGLIVVDPTPDQSDQAVGVAV